MTTDGGGWTRVAKFGSTYNITGLVYTNGFATASSAEYAHPCALFNSFTSNFVLRINMGQVKDYFKSTSNYNLCQMITEFPTTHFQWASTPNGIFQTPGYYSNHLGGSASGWPMSIDGRNYLSFWGGGGATAGCCHNSSITYGGSSDGAAWNRSFDMYFR
jgi:hypothetical protein